MQTLNLVAPDPYIDYDASWYAVASLATYVQDVVDVILTETPVEADYVGISCPYIKHSKLYAETIEKALDLSEHVHIGGMVATRAPEVIMQYVNRMYPLTIVKGYGEIAVREIVSGEKVSGAELDFCPRVDRDLLREWYVEPCEMYGECFASLLTTRQCAHNCPFCLPGNEMIYDGRGMLKRIDQFKVGDSILSYAEDGSLQVGVVKSNFSREASVRDLRYASHGPQRLIATKEHPVLTTQGWAELGDSDGSDVIWVSGNRIFGWRMRNISEFRDPWMEQVALRTQRDIENGSYEKRGKVCSETLRDGYASGRLKKTQTLETIAKILKSNQKHLNKLERTFLEACHIEGLNINRNYDVLDQNGRSICPDFVVEGSQKMIDIWTCPIRYIFKDRDDPEYQDGRINHAKSCGYKLLLHQVPDRSAKFLIENGWMDRVRRFIDNGRELHVRGIDPANVAQMGFIELDAVVQVFNVECEPFNNYIHSSGVVMHNCSQLTDSRKVLLMPAIEVVRDLEELVEEYGVTRVAIFDDNFWVSKQRIQDIIHEVKKINLEMPKLDIAMRASKINEKNISMMKKLNVYSVVIGAEAATDSVMKNLKPGVKVADLERTFEMLPENDIKVVAGFVIGHTYETEENLIALIEMIQNYGSDPDILMNVATAIPYPGTKFEEIEREAGFDPSITWFSEQVALPDKPYMKTCPVNMDVYEELVHELAKVEKACNESCKWVQ